MPIKSTKTKSKLKKKIKEKDDIASRIKPISELPFSVTCLLFGPGGKGKTTISATFPKKMLLMDISEQGTDSVCDVKGVEHFQVESWDDIENMYWYIHDNPDLYKTVSLDSVPAMQAMALKKAKVMNGKSEDEQTSKRDFGTASGMMNTWLINYRDLSVKFGINVVFIAHERKEDDDGDSDDDAAIMPTVGPNLMPSVASTLIGAVKVVGHCFIRQTREKSKTIGKKPKLITEYCLRIGPHGFYTTKIRNPKSIVVPDYLVDPTYEKIVQVMKGELPDDEPVSSKKKKKISSKR